MVWVVAVLVVVVLGATAVLATGRGGALAPPDQDEPGPGLPPPDRPLTAADLEGARFTTAVRGYRMSEVDALLARMAEELRSRPDQAARP